MKNYLAWDTDESFDTFHGRFDRMGKLIESKIRDSLPAGSADEVKAAFYMLLNEYVSMHGDLPNEKIEVINRPGGVDAILCSRVVSVPNAPPQ